MQLAQLRMLHTQGARANFIERWKIASANKTIQAYEEYVISVARLWNAFGVHDDAMLERGRARRRLEDAEDIFEADRYERKAKLIKAKSTFLDAELDEEEAEIRRAERRAKMKGGTIDVKPDPITGDYVEQEPVTAASLRRANEEQIEDFIAQKGGKANLSDEDKAHIRGLRDNLETLIRDLGL
jgi:hypothetical protein